MASFDPHTAYAKAWQYIPGVVDAKLHHRNADASDAPESDVKLHREDITTSDFRNAAMAMGVSTSDTLFCLWKLDGASPDPAAADSLVIAGVTWIVQKFRETDWGPIWLVSARKGVSNAT